MLEPLTTNHSKNTVPPWLLPCNCSMQRCHCNARLKPNLVCVRGLEHDSHPPNTPHPDITIQSFEFTYCNDRFSPETIDRKQDKNKSLEEDIKARGWKIEPLIIIITHHPWTLYSKHLKSPKHPPKKPSKKSMSLLSNQNHSNSQTQIRK